MAVYSVEVAGPHNEYVRFGATGEKLRGRWDFRNTTHRDLSDPMKHLSRAASVIPGIILSLDTTKRVAKRIDPLVDTESGRKIMASINSVFERFSATFGGKKRGLEQSVYEELTDDQVKEWGYYMRQMLDTGLAVQVPGSADLPPLEDIRKKWVGKRRNDPFAVVRRDGEEKFIDEVADKKAVTA